MPRASRKPINKNLDKELNESFYFLISSLKYSPEIDKFFNSFLSKEEKKMIPKRLMLQIMILNNISDSEIRAYLGVSYETIRTHKNNWETLEDDYKKIIEKVSMRKNVRESLKKFDKKMEKLDNFLKAKSNMKARSKVYGVD